MVYIILVLVEFILFGPKISSLQAVISLMAFHKDLS